MTVWLYMAEQQQIKYLNSFKEKMGSATSPLHSFFYYHLLLGKLFSIKARYYIGIYR